MPMEEYHSFFALFWCKSVAHYCCFMKEMTASIVYCAMKTEIGILLFSIFKIWSFDCPK